MKLKNAIPVIFLLLISASFSYAQTNNKTEKTSIIKVSETVKTSPAFAEIVLRQTEIESELEEMLVSYTEEYPKIKDARYELSVLNQSLEKINLLKPDEAKKLTSALGKLIVRKATVATDYWNLKNRYDEKHPQTMRAKRKLEIFEKAINRIMD